jgi:hypothetical protein
MKPGEAMTTKETIKRVLEQEWRDWRLPTNAIDHLADAVSAALEAPPAPQHSPLPWRRDRGDVLDARGHLVNLFAPEELDLVIPACNSHEKAVELAKKARDVSYKGSVYPADLAPLFTLSGDFLRLSGGQT